jgi:glycosyltransferase involved in cell wall biosynthesis
MLEPVTTVIPTHDRPEQLQRAIKSVESQTHGPIELLVIGSSKTPSISDLIIDADVMSARYLDANADSPASARNKGIKEANSDYIAFLDDDDEWLPSKIEDQLKKMESSGRGVCHTGVKIVGPEGNLRSTKRPTKEGNVTKSLFTEGPYGTLSAVMVRKDAAERINGFDENLITGEDGDFYIRLSQHTGFCTIPEPLVIKHAGGHSHVSDSVETIRKDNRYLIDKHQTLARQYGQSCERDMISGLHFRTGRVAANQNKYRQASRFFYKSLRYCPTDYSTLFWLFLIIGGPITFKPARYLKRLTIRITNDT